MNRNSLVLLATLLLTACGEEDPKDTEDTDVEDTGSATEGICNDEAEPDVGTATEMSDDLHEDTWFFVYMEDMSTDHTGEGAYTWMMQKAPPTPAISLGDGVQVVNMGPVGFHLVETAPQEGWVTSGTFDTDYQSGGSGSSGFEMSENVYVLRTADGRFGKVEILSAVSGVVTWRAYLQEDLDSCNIRTAE